MIDVTLYTTLAPILAGVGFGGVAWALVHRLGLPRTIEEILRPRDLRPWRERALDAARRLFSADAMEERLERAGHPWGLTAEKWALWRLAALAAGPLIGASYGLPGAGLGALAGWLGPDFVLAQLADDRRRRIAARVPAVSDLTAAVMAAGVPNVAYALERVLDERHDFDRLLRRALQEADAVGLDAALHRAGELALAEEARVFCHTLAQAHALGAKAAEFLRQQARQIHQLRAAARKAQAERAKVWLLLVALLFAFIPLFVIVLAPAMGVLSLISGF